MLGFCLAPRFMIEAANAKAAKIRRGPLRFEPFEVEGAKPLPEERRHPSGDLATHGNKHVAIRVDDLDAFPEAVTVESADVAFVGREAFGKGCFHRDCAGNPIEFVEE